MNILIYIGRTNDLFLERSRTGLPDGIELGVLDVEDARRVAPHNLKLRQVGVDNDYVQSCCDIHLGR
jgi:hypothetical protein